MTKGVKEQSIDQLVRSLEELWHVDERYNGFRTYMFSFSDDKIAELFVDMLIGVTELGKYSLIKGKMEELHRELYVEFGYKKGPVKEQNGALRFFRAHRKDQGVEAESKYFARAYIVNPNHDEIKRYGSVAPPIQAGQKILVLDTRTDKIHKPAVEEFLSAFYKAHQNH